MKGPWKVSSNPIGGRTLYIVCRLIDPKAVDHSGNREYYGGYMASKEEAQAIAEELNAEEGATI